MKRKIVALSLLVLIVAITAAADREDTAPQPTTIQELFGQADLDPVVSENFCGFILTLKGSDSVLEKLGFRNQDLIFGVDGWYFGKSEKDDLEGAIVMESDRTRTFVEVIRPGVGEAVVIDIRL